MYESCGHQPTNLHTSTSQNVITAERLYQQMSLTASAVAYSWSKWNSEVGDRERIILQGCEQMHDEPLLEVRQESVVGLRARSLLTSLYREIWRRMAVEGQERNDICVISVVDFCREPYADIRTMCYYHGAVLQAHAYISRARSITHLSHIYHTSTVTVSYVHVTLVCNARLVSSGHVSGQYRQTHK